MYIMDLSRARDLFLCFGLPAFLRMICFFILTRAPTFFHWGRTETALDTVRSVMVFADRVNFLFSNGHKLELGE